MGRLVRLLAWVVVTAGALAAFVAVGRWSPEPLGWGDLGGWLDRVSRDEAVVELVRWCGIAVAGYVLVISVFALLAEVAVAARLVSLASLLRWVGSRSTVPMLRARLWRATAVTALSVSSLSVAGGGPVAAAAPTALELTIDSPTATAPVELPGGLTVDAFAGFGAARAPSALLVKEPAIVAPPLEVVVSLAGQDGATWAVHQAVDGDTLWEIIEAHYGHVDGDLVWRVAEANGLEDPSSIPIGALITLPALGDDSTTTAGLGESTAELPTSALPPPTLQSTSVESPLPPPIATPAEVHTVRVELGDTLSEIAGEQLGDPTAWPELWDANRGRDFGGRVFEDPNLILTGWELVVPSESAATPFPPPSPPVPTAEVPARVPEALPSVATAAPAVAPDVAAPDPVPAATPQAETPSGTTAAVPTHNIPVPVIPTVSASNGPPTLVTADATDESQAEMSLPGGLGPAVLLSSGVIAAVVSRRRRRMRGASVHARLADPSALATATEAVLRSLGEGEQIARLDIALRAAATELVVSAPGVAVLGAIVSLDGGIDLLLTGAVPTAPEPWIAVTEHCWRLLASVGLDQLAPAARRANQPCPAIAHVGSTRIGDGTAMGDVFVDLEAVGLLTIEGDSPQASNVLRAIAAGVAVSPMSEIAHLIATGLPNVLLGYPLSSDAESLDIALDLAASAIGTTAATTSATLSTFALRARHQGGEAWEPAVVFASGAHRGADQGGATDADLVGLTATSGRGLAVVIDRPVDGAVWRLTQHAHQWTLQPLGLELTPVGLTVDDLDHVRQLLDEADRPPLYDFELELELELELKPSGEEDTFRMRPWTEPDWSLMVRLLGPVEVTDRDHNAVEFERTKALELVVWQSQHRDRSTRAAARTALWDLNVRDATFANVVSDARRALARLVPTIDNQEWIGRTLTEQLPLHPGVTTDAELLEGRLTHARRQSAADAVATLRPGLELVRDVPFSGTSYMWPDAEGITSHLTLVVTSAATVLAGHYLSIGDIEGVFWATGQGLKVLAGHEELIAFRMRAHARQGDLAGVRNEWASYERALNADPWSDGEPAPKLVALRRQLLSSSMLVSTSSQFGQRRNVSSTLSDACTHGTVAISEAR